MRDFLEKLLGICNVTVSWWKPELKLYDLDSSRVDYLCMCPNPVVSKQGETDIHTFVNPPVGIGDADLRTLRASKSLHLPTPPRVHSVSNKHPVWERMPAHFRTHQGGYQGWSHGELKGGFV